MIAYFVLPQGSIYSSLRQDDAAFLFTAFSCCACLVCDSYSRYRKDDDSSRKKKLYAIGGVNFALAAYTFLNIQRYIGEGNFSCVWVYLLLLLAPFIGLFDLLKMINDDADAKGRHLCKTRVKCFFIQPWASCFSAGAASC